MNEYILPFYICQAAGIIMVGGGIWLIMKQKIYLDSSTKQAVEVELPLFGKLRTNVPALGLFVLGIVPLIYPMQKLTTRYLQVEQVLNSDDLPVAVYVAVLSKPVPQNGKFKVSVPIIDSPDYTPELVYMAGPIIDHQELELGDAKHGLIVLQPKQIQDKTRAGIKNVTPDVEPPSKEFAGHGLPSGDK